MIELKKRQFYLKPLYKTLLLCFISVSYLYFIHLGYPFQFVSFFYIQIIFIFLIIPTAPRVREITFTNNGVDVDGRRFGYENLKRARIFAMGGRYSSAKYLSLNLIFLEDDEVHFYEVVYNLKKSAIANEYEKNIKGLISQKVESLDEISSIFDDYLKEKMTDGRYFLIAIGVAFSTLAFITGACLSAQMNNYDGNHLNSYFYLPLLGGVIPYLIINQLALKTSKPKYKLSASAVNKLNLQNKGMSFVTGLAGYFLSLQALYWANINYGQQENLTTNLARIQHVEMKRGKGCSLSVTAYHPELKSDLKLWDECKNWKKYKVGENIRIGFFKGSLGGYYFKN